MMTSMYVYTTRSRCFSVIIFCGVSTAKISILLLPTAELEIIIETDTHKSCICYYIFPKFSIYKIFTWLFQSHIFPRTYKNWLATGWTTLFWFPCEVGFGTHATLI